MPNYCSYSMCVKGKKENIEEFIKVLKADYNYNTNEFDADRHFFRVFDAYDNGIEKALYDDIYYSTIDGECAWSVHTCMFDGDYTYYNDMKRNHGENSRGTTIPLESKNLNLDIEIYSEEPGCGFQEHYIVRNGVVEVDDYIEYCEYFIDDFETKEEAEEEYDIEITDEEWENCECSITRGGFKDWDFSI